MIYVNYRDDGPAGLCAQACSITSPWNRLYRFENFDAFRQWLKSFEDNPPKRANPRIQNYWSDDIEDGMEMVEPVVTFEQKPKPCENCTRTVMYVDNYCLGRYGSEHCSYMPYDMNLDVDTDGAIMEDE
jgi:hypothetical protein